MAPDPTRGSYLSRVLLLIACILRTYHAPPDVHYIINSNCTLINNIHTALAISKMIFIRSLHWTVTVLLLAIVHPVISLPIQASEWVLGSSHEVEVGNAKTQNSWNAKDKEENFSSSESAHAELELVSHHCLVVYASRKVYHSDVM